MSPQLYPHLLPAERLLWSRWILTHEAEYDRYDYDVKVGPGRPVDPRHPPEIQAMAATLTKRRVDVVGFKAGAPTLFAVNPRGSRVVYSELLFYRELFRQTFAYDGPIGLRAIVQDIAPDLLQVMTAAGIHVDILPRDATPL